MAIQFSGSRSAGDRRRRRLVVNGEGTALESAMPDGDGGEMESQLVASEAAGPWVPASELRIWIYTVLIGLGLGGATYSLFSPTVFHQEIAPLAKHWLHGDDPLLVTVAQCLFFAFSAQMAMLIGWYRSQCRLDFAGRYRIWPWAAALLAITAFCSSTDTHSVLAEMIDKHHWLSWRASTVIWLLPFWVAALPITLWVDRDLRNSRSSLYSFRAALAQGVIWSMLAIYEPELGSQSWFPMTFLLLPMFGSATLFVSLWHHARVVAYVCPDPPELNERSAWSLLMGALSAVAGWLTTRSSTGTTEGDDDSKPKRRRKKTETEAAPAKRKRRTPARRTTAAAKSRYKPADTEDLESPSSNDSAADDSELAEQSSTESTDSGWDNSRDGWQDDSKVSTPTTKSQISERNLYVDEGQRASVPAPHFRKTQQSWTDTSRKDEPDGSANDSEDESDDDGQDQYGSSVSTDQLRGLSKRQKRELKRQLRDQERTRGR